MSTGKRVLVVDDDESIREIVALALSMDGHEVVTAPDGAAALRLLSASEVDLIFLDMKMPIMDGWEFARAYRQQRGTGAPIVVFTAAQDAASRAADIGSDDYLAKPFDMDRLLEIVARYLPAH